MNVTILPGHARGHVEAPPSKSMAHRYLICAALSAGESLIHHVHPSQDILATVDCLRALGATLTWEGECLRVRGVRIGTPPSAPLACRECGTTLRLMLPLCLIGGGEATLTGTKKLLSRPLDAYEDICRERGFLFEKSEESVRVRGNLQAGCYALAGNVSSQYISGLIYALSCVEGESEIRLTTEVESRSYIDLTLRALDTFGVHAAWRDASTLTVRGGQTYRAREVTVEGDWSNAAFWLALEALGDRVTVGQLDTESLQGDRVCRAYFAAMQAGCPTLSVGDCPDLAPVLMSAAALFHGATLTETARLRLKESDRGEAMRQELAKCGIPVTVEENRIVIPPCKPTSPTEPLSGHHDHRIVMALAVLLTRLGGKIEGCEAVTKSYPDFFEILTNLGIEIIKE
jgi:3-phosphoshikimate 1-carboxyvinyltransferase